MGIPYPSQTSYGEKIGMKEICSYDNCFGCSLCHDICPKNAITIGCASGFWRPEIDSQKCVDCGLCKKNCPANNISDAESLKRSAMHCYASWSRDEQTHFHSASGGLAYELSKCFIENGGCVAGCAFEDVSGTLTAKHVIVDTLTDLIKLSKSKYVHSNKDDIYKAVAEESKRRKVLFIGVSCEVFALYEYFKAGRHDITNVCTIHLLCRGGSSPFAMTRHLESLEKKYKKKISNVTFRGGEYNCQYVAYSGEEVIYRRGQFEDEYFYGFMAHTLYQPVCYKCPFAEARRISDITLADFQGLAQEIFVKAEGKGESLVLTHTEKGQELFDQIKERLVIFERPFEESAKENTTLKEPTETHEERERLWELIYKVGFEKAIHKVYWKWYAKLYTRKFVGKFWMLLPKTARMKIKKILRRG